MAPDDPLERELPTVLHDLVPLSYLVDRVVAQAYADLQNLIETLPAQPDQARKRAIVDYVLHTRRQLVKLLVLTRWSTEANPIQKAMNIVGFFSRQNGAVDAAVASLTDTSEMLARARVRNYDLATALDVLTTGSYSSLPRALADRFRAGAAAPLSDAQVLSTLRDVDDVLRWRLVLRREPVPEPLARVPWCIADGRVVFTVPGLWEATLTYAGGANDEDEGQEGAEWFLLGVTFLFRVNDATGAWSATPTGPFKEHLIELCNRELLRRPYFPPPDPTREGALPPPAVEGTMPIDGAEGEFKAPANGQLQAPSMTEGEDGKGGMANGIKAADPSEDARAEIVRKRRRDRPLDRAYTFLQRLALSYQLEAVYSSAVRLAQTRWSGNLRVEINRQRDEVRVRYWTYRPELPPTAASAGQRTPAAGGGPLPPTSGPGGTLLFSVRPPAAAEPTETRSPAILHAGAGDSSRRSAREAALREALRAAAAPASFDSADLVEGTRAASSNAGPHPPPGPLDVPAALSIAWLPPPSFPGGSIPSPTLTLPPDLDIEPLLHRVTRLHARETIHRLAQVVQETESTATVVSEDGTRPGDLGQEDYRVEVGGEVEVERAYGVPHLRVPLLPTVPTPEAATARKRARALPPSPNAQGLEAHIDPRSGRFELRFADTSSPASSTTVQEVSATTGGGGGGGGGARAQRLRAASERIDRERFAGTASGSGGPVVISAGGGATVAPLGDDTWMRSVGEMIARIRASTILDDLDTLLSLLPLPLSGPTTRRLPLPSRELLKLGPNPALQAGRSALLFVPLLVGSSGGGGASGTASGSVGGGVGAEQWFLTFVLFDEGVRAALLRARESSDGMNAFLELVEVGWLGPPDAEGALGVQAGAGGGTAAAAVGVTQSKGANLGYEPKGETVQGLWAQCVHRVTLFELERQLVARRIPYRLSAGLPALATTDKNHLHGAVASVPPRAFLLVQSAALVRLSAAERLTEQEAALHCVLDAQSRIRTTLHVRFRVPLPAHALPEPAEFPPGVLWNPKRRVLILAIQDGIEHAVKRLLRANALVLRAIVAAQAAAAAAAAAAIAPPSPSKKRVPVPTPKAQPKGLPNGTGA